MVTIRMHNHKYMGRSEAFSPPQAVRLTFHLSELCQTRWWHNCKLWEGTQRKREKDKVRMLGRDWADKEVGGRAGWKLSQRNSNPNETLKGLLKIYTLAGRFNVSNIQTICLKKNKLLLRSKSTEGPWSRPSVFLSTAVLPRCLKADLITITILIKAWNCCLQALSCNCRLGRMTWFLRSPSCRQRGKVV